MSRVQAPSLDEPGAEAFWHGWLVAVLSADPWDDDRLDDLMRVLNPKLIRYIASTTDDTPLRRAALRSAFLYMMR